MKTWLWICGWAVSRNHFRELCQIHFPRWQHEVQPATEAGLARGLASQPDRLGGYSLGSFLLLQALTNDRPSALEHGGILLAPFAAYPAEEGRGGRVHRAQLEILRRRLNRDIEAAVEDFRQRARLTIPAQQPAEHEALLEGLEILNGSGLSRSRPFCLDACWSVFCGTDDTLLNPLQLASDFPSLQIVNNAGHDPDALLAAAAQKESSYHEV